MAINYVQRPFAVTTSTGSSVSMTQETGTSADNRIVTARTVMDDGAGHFAGGWGTVNYVGKSVSLKVVTFSRSATTYKADHEDAEEFSTAVADGGGSSAGNATKGGAYGTTTVGEEVFAGSSIVATYRVGAGAPVAKSMSYTPDAVSIDLCPYTVDRIVPNSVRFTWMGTTYEDYEGVIYRDRTPSNPGIISGRVDYAAGQALMSDYVVGPNPGTITLQSLWTSKGDWRTASAFFMTGASPIQPGQITITCLDVAGDLITVDCDLYGNLTGPHARGKFEFQNGLGELQFGDFVLDSSLSAEQKGEWWYDPADVGAVEAGKIWRPWPIDPASLRYNAVSSFYLPVDPDILGLDPVRLPQDGRVPIYRKGRVVVIGHNAQLAPDTYANGDTIDCGRVRLSHVWLIDAHGALITTGFTADEDDLDAGVIHVTDITGWAQPITVEHRIQDMALCTDVQIDGTISLNIPLSHAYPAGSVASSALLFGTTYARAASLFDQQSWDGVTWADSVQGSAAVGSYNDAANPLVVTNAGALTERYAIRFASNATDFNLIGEFSGQIAVGSKNTRFEPANPFAPAEHIFEMAEAGWGSGWVAGNTVFLRLVGAMQPMAVIRTVQPGAPTGTDYSFDLLTGGDIDRPPSAP